MSVRSILNSNGKISGNFLDPAEGGFVSNPLTANLQGAGFNIVDAGVLNGVALQTESLSLLPGSAANGIAINDTLTIANNKALEFNSDVAVTASIAHDGTGLQFTGGGGGLLITNFDGEVRALATITSVSALDGGSAVLNGGLSQVTIGGVVAQNPKVRFQVPSLPDGEITYTGATFTFNPPLTDSDFQTLSILGDQLSISGGNTVTLPSGGGAPGGSNQDIQFNNSGAFGGDAGLTYNSSGRIVQLTQTNNDSRIEVIDTSTSDKTEMKSGQLNLVSAGSEVIQMTAAPNSAYIRLQRTDNTLVGTDISPESVSVASGGVYQGLINGGNFTSTDSLSGAQCRIGAVGDPVCRVASATLGTVQTPSTLDFTESNVAKAGLAYATGTGAVGLSSVNSGEVFLARTDGSLAESVIGLKADNTYAFGNINTEDDCVLQLQRGAAVASITYDGTDFVFSPALPVDGVQSIVAGSNISVDNTDPANPIVAVAISSDLDMNGNPLIATTGTLVVGGDIPTTDTQLTGVSMSIFTTSGNLQIVGQYDLPAENGTTIDMGGESETIRIQSGVGGEAYLRAGYENIPLDNPNSLRVNKSAVVVKGYSGNTVPAPPKLEFLDADVVGASPYITATGDNLSIYAPTLTLPSLAAASAPKMLYYDDTTKVVSYSDPPPVDGVQTLSAGSNISVDNTDPANPIVAVAISSTLDMSGQSITNAIGVELNDGGSITATIDGTVPSVELDNGAGNSYSLDCSANTIVFTGATASSTQTPSGIIFNDGSNVIDIDASVPSLSVTNGVVSTVVTESNVTVTDGAGVLTTVSAGEVLIQNLTENTQILPGSINGAKIGLDLSGNLRLGDATTGVSPVSINAVAIGVLAGSSGQGNQTVAIGYTAGQTSQSNFSVAIGVQAGQTNQGNEAVAIGQSPGNENQGVGAVAIGSGTGYFGQGESAVAIGTSAGNQNQGAGAIAIGKYAAQNGQGADSIQIGSYLAVAHDNQGAGSICIGAEATFNSAANSILINATGSAIAAADAGLYVTPVRATPAVTATLKSAFYDTATSEFTYGDIFPAITVQDASGTVALTPAMNRSTYILTGTNATQTFDPAGLVGEPAGFCVYLRNGNNAFGTTQDINIGITGVVGTVPLHTITTTTNSGGMLLYWDGSVLTRYR